MRPFAGKTDKFIMSDINTGYCEYIEFVTYRKIKGPALPIDISWNNEVILEFPLAK